MKVALYVSIIILNAVSLFLLPRLMKKNTYVISLAVSFGVLMILLVSAYAVTKVLASNSEKQKIQTTIVKETSNDKELYDSVNSTFSATNPAQRASWISKDGIDFIFSIVISLFIIIILGLFVQLTHRMVDMNIHFHTTYNAANLARQPIKSAIENQDTIKAMFTYAFFFGSFLMFYIRRICLKQKLPNSVEIQEFALFLLVNS